MNNQTNRRGFLGALLAAAAAPAIVKAESLMPIWVPATPKIITPQWDMGSGDFTMETWAPTLTGKWHSIHLVQGEFGKRAYVDGSRVALNHPLIAGGDFLCVPPLPKTPEPANYLQGVFDEIRITKGVARL